jgi:transcriptional regulator with XRE-family HTH domain
MRANASHIGRTSGGRRVTKSIRRPNATLRTLRRDAGLTQDRLAELSGVNVRTIRGIESGTITRPRLSTIDAVTRAVGLSVSARAQVLEELGILDSRTTPYDGAVDTPAVLDEVEERLARSRKDFRAIAVVERAQIGRSRRVSSRTTEEVLLAQEDGVSRRLIHYDPMDDTVRIDAMELGSLDNCRLQSAEAAKTGRGKFFELALDQELSRGDTYITRYSVDFDAARADDEPSGIGDGAELTGFMRPPDLYVLEVHFDPDDVPRQCTQVYQPRPFLRPTPVRRLRLNTDSSCHIALMRPRPGGHGISWSW